MGSLREKANKQKYKYPFPVQSDFGQIGGIRASHIASIRHLYTATYSEPFSTHARSTREIVPYSGVCLDPIKFSSARAALALA